MDNGQNKTKLSKGILDMKFMKKTKERVIKEQDDAEGQAMYSSDITDQMRKGEKFAFIEVSINTCKDLIDGRLSFGGMNPEIERLMEEENAKRQGKIDKAKETDISDFEMAKRFNPAVETISKKFQEKKNKPGGKNRKFMKPKEMD